MQRILITGANRGIGYELTRQFAYQGDSHIFAACRAPERADALNELSREHPGQVTALQMDVNDEASINAAVASIERQSGGLDILINNAGIASQGDHASRTLGQLFAADVSAVLSTNAVAPVIVTQACRQLLKNGNNPRVAMISSGLGLLRRAGGSSYAYRMSKAALNMSACALAQDTAMSGIITISVNPGWVKTDMGGPNAALKPEESAGGMRALIQRLSPADNGKLFQYDGTELPW